MHYFLRLTQEPATTTNVTNVEQTPSVPEWTQGDRLRKALRHADIDVNDMATVLGLSRTTISNYLADRTSPTRGTLIAWALRCGVHFEWLAHGVESPTGTGPEGGNPLTRWSQVLRIARNDEPAAA